MAGIALDAFKNTVTKLTGREAAGEAGEEGALLAKAAAPRAATRKATMASSPSKTQGADQFVKRAASARKGPVAQPPAPTPPAAAPQRSFYDRVQEEIALRNSGAIESTEQAREAAYRSVQEQKDAQYRNMWPDMFRSMQIEGYIEPTGRY